MDNLLINFSRNALRENQSYLKAFLSENLKNFADDNTKDYYKAFLNQAVEFSDVQQNASFETRPLLQFYSLLNLVKFYILSDKSYFSTTPDDINSKLKSHGASSVDRDKIKLQASGVAIEFAKSLGQTTGEVQELTLIDLYKRVPDLSLKLKHLELIGLTSSTLDFKIIEYPVKLCCLDGVLLINNFGYFKGNISDKYEIFFVHSSKFTEADSEETSFIAKIKESKEDFLKTLAFDVNGEYYLDTNKSGFCELFALYLIFLKYSSLSRYRPYDWYKKLQGKENVIIEYTMDNLFEKFWALIAKDLLKLDKYIL